MKVHNKPFILILHLFHLLPGWMNDCATRASCFVVPLHCEVRKMTNID